jgi:hypothetical protein
MLADALHTLSDGLSDGVTLWAIYMSALPHSAVPPLPPPSLQALSSPRKVAFVDDHFIVNRCACNVGLSVRARQV